MVDIRDIFDTEYLDNTIPDPVNVGPTGINKFFRGMFQPELSSDTSRELNVDLDAYREMLLQNKRYPLPTFLEGDKYTHSGWVHPAMQEKQERDIDQLGLASFDFWKDLDANVWNASRKGLDQKGLMGQYDHNTHDIFLNIDANRAAYEYSFPNEEWGKYSVLSHETVHPFTLQRTWDDINEINPLLNLDWYNKDDPEIWSEGNVHQDPTKIQDSRSSYDRMHDYLAWNANNYAGFSGYPATAQSSQPGVKYGPFMPHHNYYPTKLDVTRMSELNNLAKSWNEGTWQPANTRKESFIRGDEPRRVGNMPRVTEPRIRRDHPFAGNPHKEKYQIGNSTGGLVSLVL